MSAWWPRTFLSALSTKRVLKQYEKLAEERYRAMAGMDDPLEVRAARARRDAAHTVARRRRPSWADED